MLGCVIVGSGLALVQGCDDGADGGDASIRRRQMVDDGDADGKVKAVIGVRQVEGVGNEDFVVAVS